MSFLCVIFVSMLIAANAQRSPYAGGRPGAGYKDRFVQQSSTATTVDLNNRLGESTGPINTSTERLPYDAYGDAQIVNHWNSLPIDQRPFWIVNQQHIENHRGTPGRPAAGSPPVPTTVQPANGATGDIVNRFGANGNNVIPNLNAQSIQEVVYPSNITPEQRIQMEIQYLQNRLQALQNLQAQNQNQSQSGQQLQQQQQEQQQLLQQQRQLQQQQRRNF